MYADTFQSMAVLALDGPEAAINDIDHSLQTRHIEKDMSVVLNATGVSGKDSTFLVGHHTTEALLTLREGIINGDAQDALRAGMGEAYLIEISAEGFFKEVENVRYADMNVHHLDGNTLVPGLPEGVTREDVLRADVNGQENTTNSAGERTPWCVGNQGTTVLVDKATLDQLALDGFDVGGDKTVAHSSFLENYEMLTMGSREFSIHEIGKEDPVMSFSSQNSAITYLQNHLEHLQQHMEKRLESGQAMHDLQDNPFASAATLEREHQAQEAASVEMEASMDM